MNRIYQGQITGMQFHGAAEEQAVHNALELCGSEEYSVEDKMDEVPPPTSGYCSRIYLFPMTTARVALSLLTLFVFGGVLCGAPDFSGQNRTGADFSGQDLTGATFTGTNLTGANLTGANLSNARLDDATLPGATLTRTVLTGARFNRYTIWPTGFNPLNKGMLGPGVDLSGAWLTPVAAPLRHRVSAYSANLTGAILDQNDFTGSDFSGANFSGASLRSAILEVDPESWTGRIVNPKSEERSPCRRNVVSTVLI